MLRTLAVFAASKWGLRNATLFSIPSLMDGVSFAHFVNKQGQVLAQQIKQSLMDESPHLKSQASDKLCEEKAIAMCAPLVDLKVRDVENVVMEKYGLKSDRVATCLVPYRVGVNIILERMPSPARQEAIEGLKQMEEHIQKTGKALKEPGLIAWKEEDVYVSTGLNYLKRISPHKKESIPVFCVMGHVNHGKTTLLDALQQTDVTRAEPHGITQMLRCFTTHNPYVAHNELCTFVDTPGHAIFVESRYHAQLIADFILLVVSVAEGVHSQVHEVVKTALNVDRPIIVVLNKLDLFTDARSAERAVRQTLRDLREIGLDVTLVRGETPTTTTTTTSSSDAQDNKKDNHDDQLSTAQRQLALSISKMQSLVSLKQKELFFAKAKALDPTYRGSRSEPVLDLRRKCVGVCVSAAKGINIPFLWEVLRTCRQTCPPMRHNNTIGPKAHNCVVQAVVLESSKHLFDEEGFRQNVGRQKVQRKVDHAQEKQKERFERSSVKNRTTSMVYSVRRALNKHNRTSTTCLVLNAIVREGVISRGMHFVADQSEGKVDYLMDYWGNALDYATPGMAVTLIDARSTSGCPGVGTHILSTVNEAERIRIYNYRRMLQWYLECFSSRLELLRPRGMDVKFAHLGDYGQLKRTASLESQLLYGPPPPSSDTQQLTEGGAVVNSIGAYLQEKNEQEARNHGNALMAADGTVGRHAALTKRMEQAVLPKGEADTMEKMWASVQLQERIESQEAFDRFMAGCIKVGVLLKVDSWHSARMLQREMLRLGTKRVAFQVLGARFGGLQVEDITFFGQAIKVIVCYRVPRNDSTDVDKFVETGDMWVLYTDHFSDVITFLKWCAVTVHKKEVGDAAEPENTKRNYMVANRVPTPSTDQDDSDANDKEDQSTESTRQFNRKREGQKLLIFKDQD